MTTFVLVDDHLLVASALKRLLEDEGDFAVVGIASSVTQGKEIVRDKQPDVVLLDVRIPGGRGLSEITDFRISSPTSRIVVLTGFGEELREEAIALGADALVTKDQASSSLVSTLRKILGNGGNALSVLTERELEVARAVGNGLSNSEAAMELDLSVNTIKTHLLNAMRKLGVRDRVELAIRWGTALEQTERN